MIGTVRPPRCIRAETIPGERGEGSENMSHSIVSIGNQVRVICVCGLFLFVQGSVAETKPAQSTSSDNAFSNAALGFSYVPPTEMNDETKDGRAEIRALAGARHTNSTLALLLSMSSGLDATATNWHLLSIEAYPRQAFSNLDDVKAEAKMSAWVAGTTSLPGKSRSVVLGGQSFVVYVFAEQDGTVRKGAVVWTTIRKDKLLSFAFVANSSEQLKKLAESMKSVQFF